MKRHTNSDFREYAVSETIGFIIIFGLMMTGIGLVSLYGYPLLMKEQQNTNLRNMERNMIVLQNDLKSLTFKAVPFEETDLQIGGGTLSINPGPSNQYFTITGLVNNFHPGGLQYRSDSGGIVSLENGAVLVRYEGQSGSVMLAEPRWFFDETTKTLVIPLIDLRSDGVMSQTGIGRVRMNLTSSYQHPSPTSPTTVIVHYERDGNNDFSTAWENYLKKPEFHFISSGIPGNMIFTSSTPINLVIKTYNVTVIGL